MLHISISGKDRLSLSSKNGAKSSTSWLNSWSQFVEENRVAKTGVYRWLARMCKTRKNQFDIRLIKTARGHHSPLTI